MANDSTDRDSTNEPHEAQPGGASLSGERDVSVGGDVVGRDKVVSTSTSTTYVNEGGPAARYAIIGIVVVALAAIGLFAFLAWRNAPYPSATAPSPQGRTLTFTFTQTPVRATPDLTATRAGRPTDGAFATAKDTDTPTPTVTASATPSATPTASLAPATPTPSAPSPQRRTPTETPTPMAEVTIMPTSTQATPSASTLPLYDDFNDDCLDAARWSVQTNPADFATPAPAFASTANNCLQTDDRYFVKEEGGVLAVATSLEGEQSFGLAAANAERSTAPGCFSEAEVTLVLNEVNVFEGRRSAYLSVGVDITQRTRPARVEVRLLGGNLNGPRRYNLLVRLITAAGPSDYGLRDYTPGRPVTVAFRVINEQLVVSANGQPFTVLSEDGQLVPVAFTIRGNPCALTLGYRAEDQIALSGAFDEVRLQPAAGP